MTVDELRHALRDLPGDLEIGVAYPDQKDPGLQYETRDVRRVRLVDSGAGKVAPCCMIEAWGGM